MKDWTGNKYSAYSTIGASNHSQAEREPNDFYATEPKALELLLEIEQFDDYIWECACGAGHLSKVLRNHGYMVRSTDLYDRGYGESGVNFLGTHERFNGDIITNPPYRYALQFVEHALNVVCEGNRVAMFLKLTFLETKARKELFKKYPPKYIYVSSSRLSCAMGGDFEKFKDKSKAIAYAWFIWEKGYTGESIVRWFN